MWLPESLENTPFKNLDQNVVKLPAGLDIFQGFNIGRTGERRQAG